jgi:type I restriction enzyme S subunit
MTSDQFMANFGYIANAPGGVGKLRDLIYHFAFAGELVVHSRESAVELVDVLAGTESPTGRTRRVMLEPAAGFYPIPPHWLWVNIGDIGHDWGQTKPSGDFTYIDVSAIDNQRGVVAEGASIVSEANAPSRARKVVKKGTVIYSTVRPYLLNIAVIERDFDPAPIASTAFAILHPHDGIEAKFIYYFLRSPAFAAYVEGVQSGIAYPAISDQKFFAASFPLAPTEEQKRIVAKVDELMALCDQLEAQHQERERRFPVLSRTCHARFAEAPTSANLNRIFDETGAVSPTDLRMTILSLAVAGRLVDQHPNEASPQHFKAQNSTATTYNERVFSAALESLYVPPSWSVQPLVMIAEAVVDCPHSTPKWTPSGKMCVRTNQFKPGYLDLSDVQFVSEETYQERIQRLKPEENDILYSREGGILGVACRVPPRVELCLGQRMMLIRAGASTAPSFLEMVLNSPLITEIALNQTTGGAAPRVNVSTVRSYPIPVPPLEEQRRIVAKVNELMALVDHLEAQQQERDKLAEAFAKACVASFTGTNQHERPEKMKAPKTELVSLVTLGKKPKPDANAPLAQLLSQHKGELPAKSLWQQSGLTIDAFYQQLKTELAQGWIAPPAVAEMKVLEEA